MTYSAPAPAKLAPLFADDLRTHGDRTAVVTVDEVVTYAELDERVQAVTDRLGLQRRLVMVGAANTIDALVVYLGALRGGHPVLLAPGDNPVTMSALAAAYDPDVVVTAETGWSIDERRAGSVHELHRDLALLLPTSGSTGSSKLVRLSRQNVQSNAGAIAAYLDITAEDRAITTLPMQYCYGLSVLNSHLFAGAGIVLTDLSVVDRCFWDLFRAAEATSFAGVPFTFDLLDRVEFASMTLPTLRYVTQAGGRLHPEQVRRYAALGERDGWDLFVMYGQTEATARMAYLPPRLASSCPEAVGFPIPGGTLIIESPDHSGVGELVYRGPNVMLGYAERPDDLGLGATIDALRTGDLARVRPDGMHELVGRSARFIKPCGVRVDLDQVERLLADHGITSMCTGDDELVVAVSPDADLGTVSRVITERVRLPRRAVDVLTFDVLPRLANGKPDYVAICRRAAVVVPGPPDIALVGSDEGDQMNRQQAVRRAFAVVLGTEPGPADSFVKLGGDSLSYVEMSVRLEGLLGHLPRDWHLRPIAELAPSAKRSRWWAQIDTSVVIRAVAIVLVVGTHAKLWHLPGGAHALVGIVGYNFARFQLRAATMWSSIARIAVPSLVWIAIVADVSEKYNWRHALLLNGLIGAPDARSGYWFIEAVVQILVVLAVVFSVPALRQAQRRRPFAVAMVVVAAGLAVRFGLPSATATSSGISGPHEVLWLFALGWAANEATTNPRRLVVSGLAIASVPGFFANPSRDLIVLAALLVVVWFPTLAVPRASTRVVARVAGASLYIYLSHWQVYPVLLRLYGPLAAVVGSVALGVIAWEMARRLTARAGKLVAYRREPIAHTV